ncbi:hypothetical protein [Laceyella tengchongensis]|uniref:hypothetical protein n=1 Tax=Laceyella tengchongensis TaxID=574699 RepID=UPI0012B886C8|nr:hypothetical protein [Laceyella tengchongensis]
MINKGIKFSFCVALITVFSFSTFLKWGDAKERLEPKANVKQNSIKISFNAVGEYVSVYKKDKKVKQMGVEKGFKSLFNSSSNEFTLDGLDSNSPVKLKLKATDENNKVVDEVTIETGTLRSEKDKNEMKGNKLKDSHLVTYIRDNEVKLLWENIPDDDGVYEIFKNGKLVDKVKGNEYVDMQIKDLNTITYDIVGKTKMSAEKIRNAKEIAKKNHVFISKTKEDELFTETNALTKQLVLKSESANKSFSTKSVYYGYGQILRYQTWIPLKKAPNPSFSKYHSFAGDTRKNPDFFSNRFRTRVDVLALFNGTPKAIMYKDVGKTKGFDEKGREIGRGEARVDAKFYKRQSGSDSGGRYVDFGVIHASGNPLANPSPDIDYQYSAKVYEDGSVSAFGGGDYAPSHELWIANIQGDSIGLLHYRPHKDFLCLIPGICGAASWSKSF